MIIMILIFDNNSTKIKTIPTKTTTITTIATIT